MRRFGQPLFRATAGSLSAGVAVQLALVVSGVLSARLLGVEDRGYLALLMMFPAILTQLGGLGLPMATTFHVARDPGRARAIAGRIATPALIQAVVLVAVHATVLWIVFSDDARQIKLAAAFTLLSAPAILAQQYGLAILQGQQRFLAFNILRAVPLVLYALGTLAVFASGTGTLPQIAAAWVVAYVLVGGTTLAVARRGTSAAPSSGPAPPRRQMMKFGLKGLLGWATPVEGLRVDQAVVGLFLSPALLGLYVVGLAFTNLPGFIAKSVGSICYPHVAQESDPAAARRSMWRFVAVSVALSAAVVVGLEATIGWLLPLFFGSEFEDAVSIARVLLLYALAMSMRRILADGARGLGRPTSGSVAEVVSWLVLFPALAILAPRFEAIGVAVALVLSSTTSLVVLAVTLLVTGVKSGPVSGPINQEVVVAPTP